MSNQRSLLVRTKVQFHLHLAPRESIKMWRKIIHDLTTFFYLSLILDELQDPIIKTEPGPASRLPLLGPPHGGPYQTSSTSSSASPRIERKELIWSLSAASARQVIPINESPPPPSPMTWIRHHQDDDGDDDHQNKPIIPITI